MKWTIEPPKIDFKLTNLCGEIPLGPPEPCALRPSTYKSRWTWLLFVVIIATMVSLVLKGVWFLVGAILMVILLLLEHRDQSRHEERPPYYLDDDGTYR